MLQDVTNRLFAATQNLRGYWLSPPLATRRIPRQGMTEDDLTEGLDAVVAWSMRLTDKPLPKGSIAHIWHPDREIEGHTNMVPEAIEVMNGLAAGEGVKTICEVGFNAGHSALRWLTHSSAKVLSFDLGDHPYSRPAAMWLASQFPEKLRCKLDQRDAENGAEALAVSLAGVIRTRRILRRLELIWGDSLATVPEFHRQKPELQSELIFIDGGHSYDCAIRDLKNLAALANLQNNRVLLDDTFLDDVRRAWDEMLEMGYVEELQSWSGEIEAGSYGFTLGMYTERAAELLRVRAEE
eukprot:s2900_g13.t1